MKIYVVAPARVYTGGPTALFQLCHTLRRFGIDSYMAFYNVKPYEDPVHDDYKHFQCPWISINDVNFTQINTLNSIFPDIPLVFVHATSDKLIKPQFGKFSPDTHTLNRLKIFNAGPIEIDPNISPHFYG